MKCDRRWWNDDGAAVARWEHAKARQDRAGACIEAVLDVLAFPAVDPLWQRVLLQLGGPTRAQIFRVQPVSSDLFAGMVAFSVLERVR